MLNRLYKILLITSVLLCAVSCRRDIEVGPDVTPGGKVRLQIQTDATDYSVPVSRAMALEGEFSKTPMVLVFKGTDKDAVFSECVLSTFDGTSTYATITASDEPCIIVLVANAPGNKFFNGSAVVDFTDYNIRATLADMTLAQSQDYFMTPKLDSPRHTTAPFVGQALPMAGMLLVNSIDINTKIGTANNKVKLGRAVAKVTINVDRGSASGFQLKGVGAVNASRNAPFYRYAGTTVPDNNSDITQYRPSSATLDGFVTITRYYTTEDSPIYLYEATADQQTMLVLQADYDGEIYYYKIAFRQDDRFIAIERNYSYILNIKSAGRGYSSLDEAIQKPAANLDYEIEVVDFSSYDIVSTSEYYLGLSNSRVVLYDQGMADVNITALTIVTDLVDTGYETATITCTNGIQLISPANGKINLAQTEGATAVTEVKVFVPRIRDGEIEVQLGNLKKTITVEHAHLMDYSGLMELKDSEYISTFEIAQGEDSGWLRFSRDRVTKLEGSATFSRPGKLWAMSSSVNLDENRTMGVAYLTSHPPYDSDEGGKGRTKIYVTQLQRNISILDAWYPDYAPIPYVGAFWKWDQMGERLIKFKTNYETKGQWFAKVIEGEDWIVLDTKPSADVGITWNAGNERPADMNRYEMDELHRVNGTLTEVNGYADEGDEIYFRIGLTSVYYSNEEEARGGVVVIGYANGDFIWKIYVRQGEMDSYIFRYYDTPGRGETVRYSTYNLTSPEYLDGTMSGGDYVTDHSQVDRYAGAYVEYPSQVGSYFQWANTDYQRYAYYPSYPEGYSSINGWSTNYPTEYWGDTNKRIYFYNETCSAQNNTRPMYGYSDKAQTTPANNKYRMPVNSLWYEIPGPKESRQENVIYGYYADGFFDRRQIVNANSAEGAQAVAVSVNDHNVAYAGYLFYNPVSFNSIFFPAAGYFTDTGYRTDSGQGAYYWTQSSPDADQAWAMQVTQWFAGMETFSRAIAMPIRCAHWFDVS